jgi:hypothetical protein
VSTCHIHLLSLTLQDTEIDWSTYMQQIAIYLKGERDYRKIEGSTGPLVYPGAHVWIYKYLYRITNEGKSIQIAQYVFALVYLVALAVVLQCYRKAKVRQFPYSRIEIVGVGCGANVSTGAAIYFPPAHSVKAHAQYLPSALLQRLFRRALPLRSHLLLPAKPMASWQFLVRHGVECQDEFVTAATSNGYLDDSEVGE